VSVAILVSIVGWDGLAPGGAALEVDVANISAGIDDIDIDTLAATC
jgi:hypothetical protein